MTGQTGGEIIGVNSVAISPDGTTIAVGCDDNNVRVWKKSEDGYFYLFFMNIKKSQAHTESVEAVVFSPDGKNLYTGSLDNTLKVFKKDEPDKWAFDESLTFDNEYKNGITSIAVSGNNLYVVCGNYDGKIRIFKKNKDGKLDLLQTLELPNNYKTGSYVESLSFAPGSNFFLAGVDGGNSLLCDLTSPMPAFLGGRWFTPATTTPATTKPATTKPVIATPHVNSEIKEFTIIQELENSITQESEISMDPCTVAFSNDGEQLIIGKGTTIKLFRKKDNYASNIKFNTTYRITSVAFSPDGTKILYGDYGNNVVIGTIPLDSTLDELVDSQTLAVHKKEVTSVKFSPDGRVIVSGSMDGTVKIWKTDENQIGKYSLSETLTMNKEDIFFYEEHEEEDEEEEDDEEYEGGGKKSKRKPRTTKKKRPTKKRKHRRTKITKKKKPTKKREYSLV